MKPRESTVAFSGPFRTATPARVSTHPAFSSRYLRELSHSWTSPVTDRLDELCKLPFGWDGYCAIPVAFSNANFALNMLNSVCPTDISALPQIVPGINGDLQVEWHTGDTDIELHVIRPNKVHAWRCSRLTPEDGEEFNLTTDFTIVAHWLADLSGDTVDTRSSAA